MYTRTVLVVLVVAAVAVPAVTGGAAAQQECSFPVTRTDATGTEVTVEEEPERVVTLAPSAAQTMWEIGAKGKVVGVTKYAAYLEGAASRANVSGGSRIVVIEQVVAQQPDLVLAPDVISNETVRKLRAAGLTVYRFDAVGDFQGIYGKVRTIGRLTGECAGAAETIEGMKSRLGTVREAVEGEERPDAVYLFFGYTAGSNTFIDEIITAAGANNVAAQANISGYRQLNPETVVYRNPDWLILNSDDPAVPNSPAYNGTTAVQQNQTVVVPIEWLNQPAPRTVNAVVRLAKAFHPEAFAAANATPTETATPAATTAATAPTETETTAETTAKTASPTPASATTASGSTPVGTPGFGLLAAAVALAALLARLRA
ncbi:MAG: PGF-CTERM-anchored ABC transporter substrate-binding protein [Halobacteriales archaeon]